MNFSTDELEHLYEAMGFSISSIPELEASQSEKEAILRELLALRKKIENEIEHRAIQSSK